MLLFSIVIIMAIIFILIYPIIVKDSYLELVLRIGYLLVLYIVLIIVKSSYLGLVA
jgi:hypothetical protein